MRGKEKCKALKEIRRQIAEQNDIPYAVSQCTHKGDCKGTCPKCEAELAYLERELAIRQGLGKAVAIAGISVGVCTGLAACSPVDTLKNLTQEPVQEELSGDIQLYCEPGTQETEPEEPKPEETNPEETTDYGELEGDIDPW